MSRRLIVLLALIACSACGSPTEITQPSLPQKKLPQPEGQAVGKAPETAAPDARLRIEGPRGTPPGCLRAADLLPVIEWRLFNVPMDAKIDKAYSQGDTAGCGMTEQNSRTQNDHLRWFRDPHDPTTVLVQFDKSAIDGCRAQVDISVNGVDVLGEVVNYERGCSPPVCTVNCTPPPACAETGTCAPEPCDPVDPACRRTTQTRWQADLFCGSQPFKDIRTEADLDALYPFVLMSDGTDDSQEPLYPDAMRSQTHRQDCGGVRVVGSLVGTTATFTVDGPVTLTLISYRKNGVSVLPQKFEDGVTQTFDAAPQLLTMTVKGVR